jgi:predicted permease
VIDTALQDLTFAFRSLRKNLAFSAVAVATFALGIGANTAIFSLVNAVLLQPLPYPQSNRLVHLGLLWKDGGSNDGLTVPEFEFYRDHNSAFAAIAGYRGAATVALKRGDVPEWITSLRVTDGFFRVLGAEPVLGRDIERKSTRPGAPPVAVLSNALWRNAFGADPAIIGRPIQLDDGLYTVAGVMPPGFNFVEQRADVFLPLTLGRTIADQGMNTRIIARLKSGIGIAQARSNMAAVFESFRRQEEVQSGQRGVLVESYQKWLAGDFGTSLLMLFAAVTLLLVIACSNIASLLIARANARSREISIRLALGAGRWRLLQQFLAEGLLLAGIGTLAGVLAAEWVLSAFVSSLPWTVPVSTPVHLDATVLVFTCSLAICTSLVFGITSYWQIAKVDVNASLKESRGLGAPISARALARSVLVVAEIALCMMLSAGAGLLLKSMYLLHKQNLGFDPRQVFAMVTPFGKKASSSQVWRFEQDLLEHIEAIPGVISAAVTSDLPLEGPDNLPTQHANHPEHSIGGMEYRAVSPQYFETMRIPVLAGRAFKQSDTAASPPVAIVSESVARAWWNGRSPIGDRIVVGQYAGRTYPEVLEQPRMVVGVAANVKNLAVDEANPTTVYVPASQLTRPPDSVAWVIRAKGDVSLPAALRTAVTSVRADQRIAQMEPMSQIVAHSIARPSFDASLMSAFAAIALALTTVGIYGLLSFQVRRQTRDIAIRMALGARHRELLISVLKQGAVLSVVGIGIGLAGAGFATRLLASLLSGVQAVDLTIYALVSALLLMISLLASYIPARRASIVDPLVALRYE